MLPRCNRIITAFSFVFRIVKKIANKAVVLKLRRNFFLIRRLLFSFFFFMPRFYHISIGFPYIFFKVVLNIGGKMKCRMNGFFKKSPYFLTATVIFPNDGI